MRPLFVCSTVRLARLSQNKIICAYPFPIAGSQIFSKTPGQPTLSNRKTRLDWFVSESTESRNVIALK